MPSGKAKGTERVEQEWTEMELKGLILFRKALQEAVEKEVRLAKDPWASNAAGSYFMDAHDSLDEAIVAVQDRKTRGEQ